LRNNGQSDVTDRTALYVSGNRTARIAAGRLDVRVEEPAHRGREWVGDNNDITVLARNHASRAATTLV
jgi:hypothetical protein